MSTDLEGRLRSALRLVPEPVAGGVLQGSLLERLARRRARRRAVVLGAGAASLLALALAAAALSNGGPPRSLSASRAHGGPSVAGPRCVEVAVGAGPFHCEGSPLAGPGIENGRAAAGPAIRQPAYGPAAFGAAGGVIEVPQGASVRVSLPSGALAWTAVTVTPEAGPGRDVSVRREPGSGRSTVLLRGLARGSYEISAVGAPTCRGTTTCAGATEEWSVALVVR